MFGFRLPHQKDHTRSAGLEVAICLQFCLGTKIHSKKWILKRMCWAKHTPKIGSFVLFDYFCWIVWNVCKLIIEIWSIFWIQVISWPRISTIYLVVLIYFFEIPVPQVFLHAVVRRLLWCPLYKQISSWLINIPRQTNDWIWDAEDGCLFFSWFMSFLQCGIHVIFARNCHSCASSIHIRRSEIHLFIFLPLVRVCVFGLGRRSGQEERECGRVSQAKGTLESLVSEVVSLN